MGGMYRWRESTYLFSKTLSFNETFHNIMQIFKDIGHGVVLDDQGQDYQ